MKKRQNTRTHHVQKPSTTHYSKNISVPVEIVQLEDNSYHILISMEINGIKGDIIIDTGASVTVIDKNILPENQDGETNIEMSSGSVNGEINNVRVLNGDFKIGGKKIKAMQIASINLDYVNDMYQKHLNRKIIGLLGCDFCVKYKAIIDYRNNTLTCHF